MCEWVLSSFLPPSLLPSPSSSPSSLSLPPLPPSLLPLSSLLPSLPPFSLPPFLPPSLLVLCFVFCVLVFLSVCECAFHPPLLSFLSLSLSQSFFLSLSVSLSLSLSLSSLSLFLLSFFLSGFRSSLWVGFFSFVGPVFVVLARMGGWWSGVALCMMCVLVGQAVVCDPVLFSVEPETTSSPERILCCHPPAEGTRFQDWADQRRHRVWPGLCPLLWTFVYQVRELFLRCGLSLHFVGPAGVDWALGNECQGSERIWGRCCVRPSVFSFLEILHLGSRRAVRSVVFRRGFGRIRATCFLLSRKKQNKLCHALHGNPLFGLWAARGGECKVASLPHHVSETDVAPALEFVRKK